MWWYKTTPRKKLLFGPESSDVQLSDLGVKELVTTNMDLRVVIRAPKMEIWSKMRWKETRDIGLNLLFAFHTTEVVTVHDATQDQPR